MRLHLYAEEITPEFLEESRELAKLVFKNQTCKLIIHNALGNVIHSEVITNEEETEKNV